LHAETSSERAWAEHLGPFAAVAQSWPGPSLRWGWQSPTGGRCGWQSATICRRPAPAT